MEKVKKHKGKRLKMKVGRQEMTEKKIHSTAGDRVLSGCSAFQLWQVHSAKIFEHHSDETTNTENTNAQKLSVF